jgi:hypothetical protein
VVWCGADARRRGGKDEEEREGEGEILIVIDVYISRVRRRDVIPQASTIQR